MNSKILLKKGVKTIGLIVYSSIAIFISLVATLLFVPIDHNGMKIVFHSDAQSINVFYDVGNGFTQKNRIQSNTDEFQLPNASIIRLRFDPKPKTGNRIVKINAIYFSNSSGYHREIKGEALVDFIVPIHHVDNVVFNATAGVAEIVTNGSNPFLKFNINPQKLMDIGRLAPVIKRLTYTHFAIFLFVLICFFCIWFFRKKIYILLKLGSDFIERVDNNDERIGPTLERAPLFLRYLNPFKKENTYWILIAVLFVVFIVCYSFTNVRFRTFSVHDDALYFNMANNILGLNWLGDYQSLTLAKMPGYAIFLAFSMLLGVPYLLFVSVCYSLAIAFFLHCTYWIFEKVKLLWLLMATVLLFNPIFVVQNIIYRNQFTAICFLVFIGVIISMFNPQTIKKRRIIKILEAIITFLGIGFLFYCREETILYYGIFILAGILFFFLRKKIKYIRRNIWLPLLGSIAILFFGILFSSLNYIYYGRFIVCERKSAPYTSVLKAFHNVADPTLNNNFSKSAASCEKIEAVAQNVHDFENVAQIMCNPSNRLLKRNDYYLDKKDYQFKKQTSGIPSSHFEWYWIGCVDRAGYYKSASYVANYYRNLETKINHALSNRSLDKRETFITVGAYRMEKGDISTILNMLPQNYHTLLPTRSMFKKRFWNKTTRYSATDSEDELIIWKQALKSKSIAKNDIEHLAVVQKSWYSIFWNRCVSLFSYMIVPLLHLATPLALLIFLFTLYKKMWVDAALVFFTSSIYIAHFFLLSTVNVVAGYRAVTYPYYLISYFVIIFNVFLLVNIIVKLLVDIDLGWNRNDIQQTK